MITTNKTPLTIRVIRRWNRLSNPTTPCYFRAVVAAIGPTMTVRSDLHYMDINQQEQSRRYCQERIVTLTIRTSDPSIRDVASKRGRRVRVNACGPKKLW